MKSKLVYAIISVIPIVLICGVIGAFACPLVHPHNKVIVASLKDGVNIETSKAEIIKIPHVKRLKIKTKEEQWSKYVNKMDLPNIENPFKNTIIIRVDKQKNLKDVFEKVLQSDYAETVEYSSEAKVYEGVGSAFIRGI